MSEQSTSFNTIILSAGFSSRMGTPKALIQYNKNFNFLEKILSVYRKSGIIHQTCIVLNPSLKEKIKLKLNENEQLVVNYQPENGRFKSIKIGISNLDQKPTFIQNIDNPFVTISDLLKIASVHQKNNFVTPIINRKGAHPILISSEILTKIKNTTDTNIPLNQFLKHFRRRKIKLNNQKLLLNINTPDEYFIYFPDNKA